MPKNFFMNWDVLIANFEMEGHLNILATTALNAGSN